MEEQYWQQFMKSGDVTDYLGYRMEMYGHGGMTERQKKTNEEKSVKIACAGSVHFDRNK